MTGPAGLVSATSFAPTAGAFFALSRVLCLTLAVLLSVCCCCRDGLASRLPSAIEVDLLQAHPPADQLLIDGPLEVIKPMRRLLPAGCYRVCSHRRKVEIVLARKGPPVSSVAGAGFPLLVSGDTVVVRALNSRGLGIRYSAAVYRHYLGTVRFGADRAGRLLVSNQLPVRDYITAVVGSETLPGFALEALKAQAVLTQTRLARYRLHDVLGDTTEREAYLGADFERPEVRKAVAAVWNQIVTYKGLPITPFYHSACAGGTSDAQNVFGAEPGSLPYLRQRKCNYCRNSPFSKKTVSIIPRALFEKKFAAGCPVIVGVDGASRPLKVQLADGRQMSGFEFWLMLGQKLGWDKAPGTRYQVRAIEGGTIEITSTGAGHGVGMCQWGAAELARQGKTYRQILEYYLPGTRVEDIK